ncbi:hypothetical protein BD560DRAFT_429526 [Blakeslea trispora]|nr:hypothetical protein BD560DRAFT_429526 [Blakeslea trispora]
MLCRQKQKLLSSRLSYQKSYEEKLLYIHRLSFNLNVKKNKSKLNWNQFGMYKSYKNENEKTKLLGKTFIDLMIHFAFIIKLIFYKKQKPLKSSYQQSILNELLFEVITDIVLIAYQLKTSSTLLDHCSITLLVKDYAAFYINKRLTVDEYIAVFLHTIFDNSNDCSEASALQIELVSKLKK